MNHTSYKYITATATTAFAGNEMKKVILWGIHVNKALTGTLTVKSGSTTIGILPASTAAGDYWPSHQGILVEDLTIVNSTTEDVTVEYTNI